MSGNSAARYMRYGMDAVHADAFCKLRYTVGAPIELPFESNPDFECFRKDDDRSSQDQA